MIDWTKRHRDKIASEGRELLMENATEQQWRDGKGTWPPHSIWLWTGFIAGPPGSAPRVEKRKDLV